MERVVLVELEERKGAVRKKLICTATVILIDLLKTIN